MDISEKYINNSSLIHESFNKFIMKKNDYQTIFQMVDIIVNHMKNINILFQVFHNSRSKHTPFFSYYVKKTIN